MIPPSKIMKAVMNRVSEKKKKKQKLRPRLTTDYPDPAQHTDGLMEKEKCTFICA